MTQIEPGESCHRDQGIDLWLSKRPIVGHHRIGANCKRWLCVRCCCGRGASNKDGFARHVYITSPSEPFRGCAARLRHASCAGSCELLLGGESICIAMATAGIRYAKVTQIHISAPAHSWSWRGDKLNS